MLQRKTKVSCTGAYSKRARGGDSVFESALRKHDRYLIALEKQKRLSKALIRKDPNAEEKEKRERGFSTYVNGANALSKPKPVFLRDNFSKNQDALPNPKYAGTSPRKKTSNGDTGVSRRKFWGQESVEIATDSGAKLYASLRNLNCQYSDDFEEDSIDFEESVEKPSADPKNKQARAKSVPLTHRKFWGQGSVMIKAASGEDLRASVSNITDYSMNFEDYSDDSSTRTEDEIEEEIEVVDENSSNELADVLIHNESLLSKGKNLNNKIT